MRVAGSERDGVSLSVGRAGEEDIHPFEPVAPQRFVYLTRVCDRVGHCASTGVHSDPTATVPRLAPRQGGANAGTYSQMNNPYVLLTLSKTLPLHSFLRTCYFISLCFFPQLFKTSSWRQNVNIVPLFFCLLPTCGFRITIVYRDLLLLF